MTVFCQVCHRPMGGVAGAAMSDESTWNLAYALGVNLEKDARICADCLQRFMKAAGSLTETEHAIPPSSQQQVLAAAWSQVFVSDASLPVGVLDLGHISGYTRLSLPDFDAQMVNCEFYAITLLKNLTLSRGGDAIYHFRIRLTGVGNYVLVATSGCAARTGKKTPGLVAAWKLLDATEGASQRE